MHQLVSFLSPTKISKHVNIFQTKIWQEQVKKESDIAKQWEEDWGYQLGYDQLGNEREAKQLPRVENVSLFNKENFPITGNYYLLSRQSFNLNSTSWTTIRNYCLAHG